MFFKNLTKNFCFILVGLMCISVLTGCGSKKYEPQFVEAKHVVKNFEEVAVNLRKMFAGFAMWESEVKNKKDIHTDDDFHVVFKANVASIDLKEVGVIISKNGVSLMYGENEPKVEMIAIWNSGDNHLGFMTDRFPLNNKQEKEIVSLLKELYEKMADKVEAQIKINEYIRKTDTHVYETNTTHE